MRFGCANMCKAEAVIATITVTPVIFVPYTDGDGVQLWRRRRRWQPRASRQDIVLIRGNKNGLLLSLDCLERRGRHMAEYLPTQPPHELSLYCLERRGWHMAEYLPTQLTSRAHLIPPERYPNRHATAKETEPRTTPSNHMQSRHSDILAPGVDRLVHTVAAKR